MTHRGFAARVSPALLVVAGGVLAGLMTIAPSAQVPEPGAPIPIPPPAPRPAPKLPELEGNYKSLVGIADDDPEFPWDLEGELHEALYEKAAIYRQYIRRFTCRESARLATYNGEGEVDEETNRAYGYLLTTSGGETVSELRQEITAEGKYKKKDVRDEEPFPPAYSWVFLFSRANKPYFGYRYLGDRFDGFDWVHEIQFKGSLPFTDGKDIRQWEGVVVLDAVTKTPLEIRAEPQGQRRRIRALYERWASSFNVLGLRTAPKPLGFRARVKFGHRHSEGGTNLTFPTRMRYDTFRAVGPEQVIPTRASIREYDEYKIFTVTQKEQVGSTVD